MSWRCLIYIILKTSNLVVLKTSDLRHLEEVLKTSDLQYFQDVSFVTSWRRPIYDVLKLSDLWSLDDVFETAFVLQSRSDVYTTSKEIIFFYFVLSEIFKKI